MAPVHVDVRQGLALPADVVFAALVDWLSHADWVPMTKVRIEQGDGGVGTVFVATTGVGPLALPDRMRVDVLDTDERRVKITKIGPVLDGIVEIAVRPTGGASCMVEWREDITIRRLSAMPRVIARPIAAATRRGFESSLTRLGRRLAKASAAPVLEQP